MQPQAIHFGKFILQVALRRETRPRVVGVTGVEPVTLRLSSACSNQLSYTPMKFSFGPPPRGGGLISVGGAEGIRTPDLQLAKLPLYQLSYSPTRKSAFAAGQRSISFT